MKRLVYLPCEIKSRDLLARLLIADYLLKAGIPVVLGDIWSMEANAATAVPGCWLFATANKVQAKVMSHVKSSGHRVFTTDEESLPLVDALTTASTEAVEMCDGFFVHNSAHETSLKARFPSHARKFKMTGSARIEALASIEMLVVPVSSTPATASSTHWLVDPNNAWTD